MMKNNKKIYFFIAVLTLLSLVFSIVILIQKTSYNPVINNICSALNSESQCESVQKSRYSKTFGIDNPWYGIIGFSAILIFAILNFLKEKKILKKLIIAGGIISGSMAIYFLYIQSFILKQYCIFCVIVDILSIVLLCISLYITYIECKIECKKKI
ncbi:MAG: hypothetical protein KatS3mg002_0922 [Candidatus Woesearchaeota archaeon]|nr:MAG: hypothetical protein KatS3mg002_0922 [Candidatus Woesearchaeota archaeon]